MLDKPTAVLAAALVLAGFPPAVLAAALVLDGVPPGVLAAPQRHP